MRTKKLIKSFRFEEDNRSRVTLGTNVRLNPDQHWLQLKEDSSGQYPTTADLYAKTWLTNPESVKQWLNFQVDVVNFEVDGAVVTLVGFKLNDGTNDRYWDGGAWSVAGASNWNTEAQIANNISTFPATSKELQVIVNLKTANSDYTPIVREVKVLWASDVEFQEDIVYRSLVRLLRQEIRPIADYPFEVATSSSVLDLKDDYPLATPYNVVGIDAVFNDTDDPNHETDLFSSFNQGTLEVTLSSPIAAGKLVWVRFIYEPEVSVSTGREYEELEKVPQLVLDNIEMVDTTEMPCFDHVLNKDSGEGTKVHAPIRGDLQVDMDVITDKQTDQMRTAGEVARFFGNNPTLFSTGLDEEYRLWLIDEYRLVQPARGPNMHQGRVRFRIVHVLVWHKDSEPAYAEERFHLAGYMNVTVEA